MNATAPPKSRLFSKKEEIEIKMSLGTKQRLMSELNMHLRR